MSELFTSRTHAELVSRAARWLRSSVGCGVVLTECSGCGTPGMGWEIPDAIGWKGNGRLSYLVECKVSRSDFFVDAKKIHRTLYVGAGRKRYFMVPDGLVGPDETPDGWGLLALKRDRVRVAREAPDRDDQDQDELMRLHREVGALYSELRKVEILRSGGALTKSRKAEELAGFLLPPG